MRRTVVAPLGASVVTGLVLALGATPASLAAAAAGDPVQTDEPALDMTGAAIVAAAAELRLHRDADVPARLATRTGRP